MRETGIMIKLMERADISTQMALSMMENGLTTNSVVLGPKSGQMEQSMKGTTEMGKRKGMAHSHFLMAAFTKVTSTSMK